MDSTSLTGAPRQIRGLEIEMNASIKTFEIKDINGFFVSFQEAKSAEQALWIAKMHYRTAYRAVAW